MTPDSTPGPKPGHPISWRLLGRVGPELAVVFIGVYAAFALSEYESRRDAAARQWQLEAALVSEIQDITSNRRVATTLPPHSLLSSRPWASAS